MTNTNTAIDSFLDPPLSYSASVEEKKKKVYATFALQPSKPKVFRKCKVLAKTQM